MKKPITMHELSRMYSRNKNYIIFATIVTTTVLNKYVLTDDNLMWEVAMKGLALNLFAYSAADYIDTKKKSSLILAIIFASELLAVFKGWSLKTNYYTEIILILTLSGIYSAIKLWGKR